MLGFHIMTMSIDDIFSKLLFYVSVPKCVLCAERLDIDDRGLCKSCRRTYEDHKNMNCSKCKKLIAECSCVNYILRSNKVKRHYKMFKYRSSEESAPGNHLIYSLKRDNREDVISFLADELNELVDRHFSDGERDNMIITNVPRRKKAILSHGFDHTAQLGKALEKRSGIEFKTILISKGKKAQKQTVGKERLKNAVFDYKKGRAEDLGGKTVLILDDIVTTGASVGAAALLLKELGAKECVALTVAATYKDQ